MISGDHPQKFGSGSVLFFFPSIVQGVHLTPLLLPFLPPPTLPLSFPTPSPPHHCHDADEPGRVATSMGPEASGGPWGSPSSVSTNWPAPGPGGDPGLQSPGVGGAFLHLRATPGGSWPGARHQPEPGLAYLSPLLNASKLDLGPR